MNKGLDVNDMYHLAISYEIKAVDYYKISAKKAHSKALYKLAIYHENGLGVEKDMQKAFIYYNQAASCGFSDA